MTMPRSLPQCARAAAQEVRPLLRREAHLKALSILLYVCALGTFGGLCSYYALDVKIFNESVVAAEPRAGAEWNCSLIVTHTDTQPASFDQAWLDSAVAAPGSGVTVLKLADYTNEMAYAFECACALTGDFLEIATFTSGSSAGGAYMSLARPQDSLPAEFLKVSWGTAYFSSRTACVKEADAVLAATLTFDTWVLQPSSTGGVHYAVGRFAANGSLPGVNLEFSGRFTLPKTVSAQIYLKAYAVGGAVDLNTPAVAAKIAAFVRSPFMAAVRTEYIKLICKPFAALKPYSCTRAVVQRRPPLVRARSSAHFPSLFASP